jgi:hypothetical protein
LVEEEFHAADQRRVSNRERFRASPRAESGRRRAES